MSNILDETNQSQTFPLPMDADSGKQMKAPTRAELEALGKGERIEIKVNGTWCLTGLRAKSDVGPYHKTVINIKAKAPADSDYQGAGEVAIWLQPDKVMNPKNPQRNRAGDLVALVTECLGVDSRDSFDDLDGDPLLGAIVACATAFNGTGAFRGQLYWGWRCYEATDGTLKIATEHDFRYIKSAGAAVLVNDTDLPY